MARGGTLFLDEIGEMPFHLRSKLLGVLDGQGIKPLGSQSIQSVDTRIITATKADLSHAISIKRFREDLFYRLSLVHIHVPPLRERLTDLPDLCRYFLSRLAPEQHCEIPKEEIEALQGYHWPGNVREPRNIIERAILVGQRPHLHPSYFLKRLSIRCAHAPSQPPPGGIKPLQLMEQEHIRKALSNAFYHGHQKNPSKAIHLRVLLGQKGLMIEIRDQGSGFNSEEVYVSFQNKKPYFDSAGNGIRLMAASSWFGIFHHAGGTAFYMLYLFKADLKDLPSRHILIPVRSQDL